MILARQSAAGSGESDAGLAIAKALDFQAFGIALW
jgi:hypothetical protein